MSGCWYDTVHALCFSERGKALGGVWVGMLQICPDAHVKLMNIIIFVHFWLDFFSNFFYSNHLHDVQIAREVLDAAARMIRPGVTTDEIDEVVHEATIAAGKFSQVTMEVP